MGNCCAVNKEDKQEEKYIFQQDQERFEEKEIPFDKFKAGNNENISPKQGSMKSGNMAHVVKKEEQQEDPQYQKVSDVFITFFRTKKL